MKKRHLLVSLMTLVLCLTLISGATFALFTSESKVNIAVTSGKVAVKAEIDNLKTYSLDVLQDAGKFENGGTAVLSEQNSKLNLNLMTPGDKAVLNIKMENTSNVKIKYRIVLAISGELASGLKSKAKFDGNEYALDSGETDWFDLESLADIPDVEVEIELPLEAGNEYQEKTAEVIVTVEAIQWNTPLESKWDGTADTTWYNDQDTEFALDEAAQLAGLADLVDGGNTFEGKTIKLATDMNLEAYDANDERISFDPIGYGYNVVFKGTFDGQGNTIKNLYQNGWALGLDYSTEGGGLFASVVDAQFKNLNIDNSEIVMECIDMGTLVGYSYGNCTYENITITNSTVANYNRYTGGLVGEVNGTQTFRNISIDETNTVSALWGTYDAAVGGIVGGKYGEANLTFENCTVACQLDAFNDACSNYQYYNYRLSGMLIGMSEEVTAGVATASYLTCNNVTVIYNDWANYTYCEFESNGAGSYNGPGEWKFSRVQPGYSYGGVAAGHTHGVDESHEKLLRFDQLFGGDKGVRGGATHAGVTVIYNNK